jgi:hypothetical protein
MSAQKIHIDPMIPHYQVKTYESSSKGGKASYSNLNSSLTVKNDEIENPESEAIEAKRVKNSFNPSESEMPDYIKEAEKEGVKEAMKETVKDQKKNTFKFFGLLNKSEKLVYRIKNIIPVFTGEVVIDTAKITVINRPFFFSERIHSISIKDISDVFIDTAPFFGTLNIVDTNFAETTIKQKWFWKKDAEKARRIITGLMAAAKEEVDLKNIDDDGLDEKLEEIGRLRGSVTSVSKA